jgi:hypothetical protein
MSRNFTLPTFNIEAGIYRFARGSTSVPPVGSPDVVTIGNFSGGFRTWIEATVLDQQWLLVPWLTDVRDGLRENTAQPDWIECPIGSGMWYVVSQVLFFGTGFPNAHYGVILQAGGTRAPAQAVPYAPTPGPPPPPAPPGPVGQGVLGPGDPLTLTLPANPGGGTFVVILGMVSGGGAVVPATNSAAMGVIFPAYTTGGPTVGSDTSQSLVYILPAWPGSDVLTFTEGQSMILLYHVYLLPQVTAALDGRNAAQSATSPLTLSSGAPVVGLMEPVFAFSLFADSVTSPTWSVGWAFTPSADQFVVATSASWVFSVARQYASPPTNPSVTIGIVPILSTVAIGLGIETNLV